ncbi:hypothetical protein [Sulfobacillus harzensis]|uniref:Uncharacterized protein n=1 Tax=Sulfobacillus harzensis TaxID=2729629 RepID=A0A7Y0L432_9FIRM|nr:hypothetical protein [Sulfobacillus harzensis]NMP22035.1 hypothetical protein [Sulfobacillus harzensis]
MRFISALFVVGAIVVGGIFTVMSVQHYIAQNHQTMFAASLTLLLVGIVGLGAVLTRGGSRKS